jgi:2-methylisocitrate lyase-like PEP mutase family enzyme
VTKKLSTIMPICQTAGRVRIVLEKAKHYDIQHLVVNARTDALIHDGHVANIITRRKVYLAAGATTVVVWPRNYEITFDRRLYGCILHYKS